MYSEKEIETYVCGILKRAKSDHNLLADLVVKNSNLQRSISLVELINTNEYDVIEDNSDWNPDKHLMVDVIGGMTPDIVLRDTVTRENRVLIEVKRTAKLNYGACDSQIVRYFLYLIGATSRRNSTGIRRAVLVAAPPEWFDNESWRYFIKTYSGLANSLNVVIGEIHCI